MDWFGLKVKQRIVVTNRRFVGWRDVVVVVVYQGPAGPMPHGLPHGVHGTGPHGGGVNKIGL